MKQTKIHVISVCKMSPEINTGVILVADDQRNAAAIVCGMEEALRVQDEKYEETYGLFGTMLQILQDQKSQILLQLKGEGEHTALLQTHSNGIKLYAIPWVDAMLLSLHDIELYVESTRWEEISGHYDGDSARTHIPIELISEQALQAMLKGCVETEEYEAAQYLKEQIESRKK